MFAPDSRLPTPNPDVLFKPLDEGGVLLSSVEEVYYGVNPIGARIWMLLPPVNSTFGELCDVLFSENSDVDRELIRRDVQQFIDDIVAHRLVSPSASAPSDNVSTATKERSSSTGGSRELG